LRLAIEIDGEIHEKQKDYDVLRQELIENEGISFIRISNDDVKSDIKILLDKIINMPKAPLAQFRERRHAGGFSAERGQEVRKNARRTGVRANSFSENKLFDFPNNIRNELN